jgi:hypothetical protein
MTAHVSCVGTNGTVMPSTEKLDTHRKALTLNLDTSKFGSFAKIGAGQESRAGSLQLAALQARSPK